MIRASKKMLEANSNFEVNKYIILKKAVDEQFIA